MPIAVAPDVLYNGDFEDGQNPWKTSLPEDRFASLALESDGGGNDFVTSTGPWWVDPNHADPGAGYLNLLFFSYLADLNGGAADFHFAGTTLTVDIRPTDLVLPAGAHVYFWFQAYDVAIDRYVNYVMSSTPIEDQLVDGEWSTVSITLSAEDADWTALGSAVDRRSVYGISPTVAHALSSQVVDWGIFAFLGNGLPPAEVTGSIAFDNVSIALDPDGVRSFMERAVNAGPQRFDIAVEVGERGSGFDGVVLEASIAGMAGNEVLTVSGGVAGLSISNDEIWRNGVMIGEFSGGSGSPLIVTFNADATGDAIEAVIYALGYSTSSDNPATSRLVDVTLTDVDTTTTPVASFELRLVPEPESDGDDVYVFTNSSDTVSPIFDEGGADTIDASLVTLNSTISLKLGHFPVGELEIYTVGSTTIETVLAGSGNDFVRGSASADIIEGNDGNDTLYGEEGSDTLRGGAGNDSLQGGLGADLLDGGTGFDIAYFSDSSSGVVADLLNLDGASADTFVSIEALSGSSHDDRLLGDSEANLLLGVVGNDLLMGRDGNDQLFGGDGTDTLDGGTGADSMTGGRGDDWFYVDNAGDVVNEAAGEGTDRVFASASYALLTGSHVEILSTVSTTATTAMDLSGNELANNVYGNNGANFLSGSGGNDTLIAHDGNDILDGGAGNDTMSGGLGDDWFYVDAAGDIVQEAAGKGDDRVIASVSYALAAGVDIETLATADLASTVAIDLTGNGLANAVYGNNGANFLIGGGGNDTLIAHGGNDTLDGGTGADSMTGGLGNDWFYVDNAGDVVNEAAGEGTDRVLASRTYALAAGVSVETLSTNDTTATATITLTGNELAQAIYGNHGNNGLYGGGGNDTLVAHDGNDTLDGGTGADTMAGGHGDDWFYVDNAGDLVNEAAGQGTDRVLASTSFTLGAGVHVETLSTGHVFGTTAITLTGNELTNNIYGNYGNNSLYGGSGNNTLVGHDGDDTLYGGAGVDTMLGGFGNDWFYVDNAADIVSEATGQGVDRVFAAVSYTLAAGTSIETLSTNDNAGTAAIALTGNELANEVYGNAGNNILKGGGGNDRLLAHDGNDILDGGTGADVLDGGAGADVFRFTSPLGAGGVDTILGYSVADDTIELDNAVFAGLAAGALSESAFTLGGAAQDAGDRILYDSATGALLFDADGTGGGAAVQFASLPAGLALTANEFLVI